MLQERRCDPDGWVDAGQGRSWQVPNTSSLARVRGRLGTDPLYMLSDSVAGLVGAPEAPGVFCCGLRVISVDGSTTDVPDTPVNAAYFRTARQWHPGGVFPQVRWLAAAESDIGALFEATVGPSTTGEQSLALDLLAVLEPGMLVVADRNFLSPPGHQGPGYRGAHPVAVSASFALRPIKVLADGIYLARMNPARKVDGPQG